MHFSQNTSLQAQQADTVLASVRGEALQYQPAEAVAAECRPRRVAGSKMRLELAYQRGSVRRVRAL